MPKPLVLHEKGLAIRLIENQRADLQPGRRPVPSGPWAMRGDARRGRSSASDRRSSSAAQIRAFPEAGPAPLSLIVRARTDRIWPFSGAEIGGHGRRGWGEGKKMRKAKPGAVAGRGCAHA